MSSITIGPSTRPLAEADPTWITQNINGRRQDGMSVCVQVQIRERDANVTLTTPGCPSGFAGGRAPNPLERRILELWSKLGLDQPEFAAGNVVAFLKQLSRLL